MKTTKLCHSVCVTEIRKCYKLTTQLAWNVANSAMELNQAGGHMLARQRTLESSHGTDSLPWVVLKREREEANTTTLAHRCRFYVPSTLTAFVTLPTGSRSVNTRQDVVVLSWQLLCITAQTNKMAGSMIHNPLNKSLFFYSPLPLVTEGAVRQLWSIRELRRGLFNSGSTSRRSISSCWYSTPSFKLPAT